MVDALSSGGSIRKVVLVRIQSRAQLINEQQKVGLSSTFFIFIFMSPFQKILRDPATWSLILLNLIFIYEYNDDPRQYTSIIWLYWCQSVLIGVFNFLDMVTLKNIDVSELNISGRPATSKQAKGCLPMFFLFHYGMFHLGYFIFLLVDFK